MPRPKKFATEKPKNTKATVKRLIQYIGKQKKLLVGMIIFVILSSVAMVAVSVFIQPIVDKLLIPAVGKGFSFELFKPMKKSFIIMASIFTVALVASYGKAKCSVYLTQRTLNTLRRDLFNSVSDFPISFFDSVPNGEIMSRFTNDVESLRAFLSQGLSQLISSAITIVGSFCIMLYYSPLLTVLVVVMVLFMIFIVTKLGKKSSFYFKKQQQNIGVVNGFIEETIEGQKVVKVFNHEEKIKEHFGEINENLRKASTGANTFASILFPLMGNLSHINYAITAALGGVLAIKGALTAGGIVAFLTNSKNFSQPITNLSQQFNNAIMAIAGAERIFEYLDGEPEKDDGYVMLVNAKENENGELVYISRKDFQIKHRERSYDSKTEEREEKQRVDRPQNHQNKSQNAQRKSVNHGKTAQNRVQNEDARKVNSRTEVRNPLLARRIEHVYRRAHKFYAVPCGKDHQFEFCLVARREEPQSVKFLERIETVSRLRILQVISSLDPEPEVAELVGKLTAAAAFHLLQILAFANNKRAGILLISLQHQWNILGKMLSVGIERDGIGKSKFLGFSETGFQSRALAFVSSKRNDVKTLVYV